MTGDDNSIHTLVQAQVVDPRTGVRKLTNTFEIAFATEKQTQHSQQLKQLIPHTYADAMDYVYGQRAFQVLIFKIEEHFV